MDVLTIWCELSLLCDYRCVVIPWTPIRLSSHLLFVVWLQKENHMDLRIINFPDKKFKSYLIKHFDSDGDGEISLTDALSITKVLCPQSGIKSLAGIEYFPNLSILDCSRNKLEALDVSQNSRLEYLSCYQNFELEQLNITSNISLISLYCGNCSLYSLDVSKNTELSILSCGFNSIEEIDLCQNVKLSLLRVRRCGLEELEIRNLMNLQYLDCSENKIHELRLYNCKELTDLNCNGNDLHNDLYIGANTKLKNLDCRRNPNLYSITFSDGQHVENVISHIRPTTESYRKYLAWKEHNEEHLNDSWDDNRGDWEDQTLDAFEGDESNYWNIE